ncbi:MAG: tetratricopeptide repeat protein [Myxococcaceae bacterium]
MANSVLAVALIVSLAAPKGDPNEAAARAAAAEAKTAYEASDYAKALDAYTKAYGLKQAPRLLFNIAQCHRQLGHHEQAITFFQRYLDSGPATEQADATKELIADERVKRDAQLQKEAAEKETARQLELEKARAEAANAEAAATEKKLETIRQREELQRKLTEAPPPPPEEKPAVYERWWFWGAIGVVVVGGVAAGVAVANQPHPTQTTFGDINAR